MPGDIKTGGGIVFWKTRGLRERSPAWTSTSGFCLIIVSIADRVYSGPTDVTGRSTGSFPEKLLPLPDQPGPEFVRLLTLQRELLPVPFLLCFRIEPGSNIFGIIIELERIGDKE